MKYSIIFLFAFLAFSLFGQDEWEVSVKDKANLSPIMFDEDFSQSGSMIYNRSCASCHGNPGNANFAIMIPSPGDPGSEQFQSQTDGELYYKILKGRNTMPKFEDVFGGEEIWSLVAYMRSFNKTYEQELMKMDNMVQHNFELVMSFDENISKLVVKVKDDGKPAIDVSVSGFIKSMFGKMNLGRVKTNNLGIAYFDVDTKLPADINGELHFQAKASQDYSSKKIEKKIKISEPVEKLDAAEGRHLWSSNAKAPIWLIVTFWSTLIGVWGTIVYIIFGIRKIKKFKS